MVSEKETANIRRFVCGQLRQEADLSTLTLGILKKRYLAHLGCDSLSPEAKHLLKQVVQEELLKMQDNDNSGSDTETKKTQKKRKREKEDDEVISEKEVESRAKKSRVNHLSSSSESEEKEDCKTGSEQSDDEDEHIQSDDESEQKVKKSQPKTNGKSKRQISSDDSSDEEDTKSGKKENDSNCGDSPKEVVKKTENATKNEETRSNKTSEGKKMPQSDEENDTDSERSNKTNDNEPSDDSDKEEKVSVGRKNNDTDSDSSSLPSLEDQKESEKENAQDEEKKKKKEKKKTVKKDENTKRQKDDGKALVRLKRYISLCGVRRNYKKLLDGCHSVRSKVAVLKKELEELGVHGQASIEKCKQVRMKREEAQEIADLDLNNIITTQGRPKRRQAWQQQDPPSSVYQRSLNSGSDSDQEQNTRRKVTQWANLRGIISDDGDSD